MEEQVPKLTPKDARELRARLYARRFGTIGQRGDVTRVHEVPGLFDERIPMSELLPKEESK